MKESINILGILLVFLFSNFAVAQLKSENYERNFKLGVGLNTGVPFNDPYSFNIGADARLQYNISANYSITLTSGYNNLFVKGDGKNLGYVPIKVGYKTFLFSNEFYVMGEFGGAFTTTKDISDNSVLFSPSIGYATKYVDISLRYEVLKDFTVIRDNVEDNGMSQIMVRLAYGFDL